MINFTSEMSLEKLIFLGVTILKIKKKLKLKIFGKKPRVILFYLFIAIILIILFVIYLSMQQEILKL